MTLSKSARKMQRKSLRLVFQVALAQAVQMPSLGGREMKGRRAEQSKRNQLPASAGSAGRDRASHSKRSPRSPPEISHCRVAQLGEDGRHFHEPARVANLLRAPLWRPHA